MKYISKTFNEDDDGFNGNCEGYIIESNKENLEIFLSQYTKLAKDISSSIKENIKEILIIKNINVDEEFQGCGYGSEILSYMLNESYCSAAILICDIHENQKQGFILEKFYENNDFKTILIENDYPIMIFPIELAEKLINCINIKIHIPMKMT